MRELSKVVTVGVLIVGVSLSFACVASIFQPRAMSECDEASDYALSIPDAKAPLPRDENGGG